jgi:uncharacterized repeat protein (TIGR03803 family)
LILPAATAIALPAQTLTTLHSFVGADGALPFASLVLGADGNFYGTTEEGGANQGGTIFQITPSGTLTTLYSFCAQMSAEGICAEGLYPTAGLVQTLSGSFYGTTSTGGSNLCGGPEGCGTIFTITASGVLTTIYTFCSEPVACTDGYAPTARLVVGTDGNLYGTTSQGGAQGGGTVFRITPLGALTTLYTFCQQSGCTDGANGGVMIQGRDGNFYGTTSVGGTNVCSTTGTGCGTVFRMTPSGALTTLYSFCSEGGTHCTDGAHPDVLMEGSDGNLYGLTNGTVFKMSTSGALTTL